MKLTDSAIRAVLQHRRWRAESCKPLQALLWLIGGLATAPIWLWLLGGFAR